MDDPAAGTDDSAGTGRSVARLQAELTEAVRTRPDDPRTTEIGSDLAHAYANAGRHEPAVGAFRAVLTRQRAVHGDRDALERARLPPRVRAAEHLASAMIVHGDLVGARDLLTDVVPLGRRVLGREHPVTVRCERTLALIVHPPN